MTIENRILIQLYREMLRIRLFEEKVAGLLGGPEAIRCPVHLYTGQEAVAVGVCANLKRDDVVYSTHRSHGHYLAKGGDMNALMAELYGKATGCSRGRGGSMHLSQPNIGFPGSSAIVGGTIPLAVGAALSFKTLGNDQVAVVFFGDGATNEGVFYESLNFASLKKLPVIFVCENNLYSTHMPVDECLASTEIYRKADAFCLPGARIDGNDVIAVYDSAAKAIAQARRGEGPTLLECLTYRLRGHVGPNNDLNKGLRSQEEYDAWQAKDPVRILEAQLVEKHIISEGDRTLIHEELAIEIEASLDFASGSAFPEKGTILDDVFR